jgi:hypothetical protein
LTDTEAVERTVIVHKDGRIVPIDHFVDELLERLGGCKIGAFAKISFIRPPEDIRW